jgi:hypothetical protein
MGKDKSMGELQGQQAEAPVPSAFWGRRGQGHPDRHQGGWGSPLLW